MKRLLFYAIVSLIGCVGFLSIAAAGERPDAAGTSDHPSSNLHVASGFLSQNDDSSTEKDVAPPEPVGHASISVASNLVTLQVLVTDDKGNVITGLKPENFTVYEDNVKQTITNFSPIEANITVVMLIERTARSSYSLEMHYFDQIYNIMTSFVRQLRRGDWIGVIGYDIKPTLLCDFTQNHQEVLDTLNIFRTPAIRENDLFDAVIDTIDRTQELDGKVAVLLVSTGLNSFSGSTLDDVLKKCRSANAVIYSVGMGQYYRLLLESYGYLSSEESMDYAMADSQLMYISEYTGGAAYFPRLDSEVPSIINDITVQLRSQYSIGYVSTNTKKDDKLRKIKVEVQADLKVNGKPVKFKVKTRKGYIPKPY